jgi:hypothetical protein
MLPERSEKEKTRPTFEPLKQTGAVTGSLMTSSLSPVSWLSSTLGWRRVGEGGGAGRARALEEGRGCVGGVLAGEGQRFRATGAGQAERFRACLRAVEGGCSGVC